MSCYLMANQNTTSCFAAPQEGTATEVQVDQGAIVEAVKAFTRQAELVEAVKALVIDADLNAVYKRGAQASTQYVVNKNLRRHEDAAYWAGVGAECTRLTLDMVLARPNVPRKKGVARATSVKHAKSKKPGPFVPDPDAPKRKPRSRKEETEAARERVVRDTVAAALSGVVKQAKEAEAAAGEPKSDHRLKRLRDKMRKLRDQRVRPQGLFTATLRHEVDIGPDIRKIVAGITTSLAEAITTITGGDGKFGVGVRNVLKYVVPAVAILWTMQNLGLPLTAILALVPLPLLWPMGIRRAQSVLSEDSVTSAAKMICMGIVCTLVGKKMPIGTVVSVMSRLEPFRAATGTGLDFMLGAIDWLVNSVLSCLPGGMHFDLFSRRVDQASRWQKDVFDTCKNVEETPEYIEKVSQLYEEGVSIQDILPALKSQNAWRKISECYAGVKDQVVSSRQSRVEPVALVLQGSPGVGKSIMLKALTSIFMARMHRDLFARYDAQPGAFMYNKGREKFWSGYSALHKVMVLDDLGMARPERPDANSEDDFTLIMRCINTAVYPLPQAELAKKGSTYFKSDFILATTNLTQQELQDQAKKVLNKPEAINRRLQLFVEVKPLDEFTKDGKLDMAKYALLPSRDKLRCWQFNVDQHVGGDKFERVLSTTDAMELMTLVCDRATEKRRLAAMVDDDSRAVGKAVMAETDSATKIDIKPQALFTEMVPYLVRAHDWIAGTHFGGIDLPTTMFLSAAKTSVVVVAAIAALRLLLLPATKIILKGIIGALSTVSQWFGGRRAIKPQGVVADDTEQVFAKACYALDIDKGDGFKNFGGIVFVKGQDALMHYHGLHGILRLLDSGVDVTARFSNASGEMFTLSPAELRAYSYRRRVAIKSDVGDYEDAVLIRIPKVRPHKDITHMFEEGAAVYGSSYQYVAVDGASLVAHDARKPMIVCNLTYGDGDDIFKAAEALSANYPNQNGMCGGVLTYRSQHKAQNMRIWGIHVAGDGNSQAYSIRVTQQWVADGIKQLDDSSPPLALADHIREVPVGDVVPALGPLVPIHVTTRRQYHPHAEGEASMHPTAISGWSDGLPGAEKFVPSLCAFKPTCAAMAKWVSPPCLNGDLDPKLVAVARSTLQELGVSEFSGRVLTIDEALTGIVDGIKRLERINVSSSPGFPLSAERVDKKRMFNASGTIAYGKDYDLLVSQVKAIVGAMNKGADCPVVFKVSPKPEVLPVRKTLPRIIQGAPLEYVVAFRMYFWEVLAYFSRWAPDKECATGLNPYGEHWQELVRFLNPTEKPNVIAGDYKSFDSTHEPLLADALKAALLSFYDGGIKGHDYSIRFSLMAPLCGAQVLLGDFVYKLPRGLPSGHPMTAVWNSLYNSYVFRLAYYMCVCKVPDGQIVNQACVDRANAREFGRVVKLAVLGDDNLATSTCAEFNERSLPGLMGRLGLTYTMDVKTEDAVSDFRSLRDVSFIARGFLSEDGDWFSPLRLASILDEGQWVQKPRMTTQPGWYVDRLTHILLELSQHDQQTWDELAEIAVSRIVGALSDTHAAEEVSHFMRTHPPVRATRESRLAWRARIGALSALYFD